MAELDFHVAAIIFALHIGAAHDVRRHLLIDDPSEFPTNQTILGSSLNFPFILAVFGGVSSLKLVARSPGDLHLDVARVPSDGWQEAKVSAPMTPSLEPIRLARSRRPTKKGDQ